MRKNHTKERRIRNLQVKLGHGGTLDPLATGVLILGLGAATKELPSFLKCSKTYETTILFGASTDSYDSTGKILAKAPFSHITKFKVEEALGKFRGQISQRPPIFSALKMDGKKLYEYARAGKELPKEIEERSMTVSSIEVMDWLPEGSHEYCMPKEEAEEAKKSFAATVMELPKATQTVTEKLDTEPEPTVLGKRKASNDGGPVIFAPNSEGTQSKAQQLLMSGALQKSSNVDDVGADDKNLTLGSAPVPTESIRAPAAKIRMTVSSGFYVRSFCNDLGKAVDSLAHMVQLSRTRQGDFELGKNVLDHLDLTGDEKLWAPKLKDRLAEWQKRHSDISDQHG